MINIQKFLKSVPFAWEGIITLFKSENNAKIHLLAVVVVVISGFLIGFSEAEWLAIILTMSGVLALEAVNTAIEALVDLASPAFHPLAKKAKDVAAGAVLLFVFGALVVAGIILWNHFSYIISSIL
ncbi:undecaprenol kinase/diacylglycerol kinase (ATP) [Arcicella aurantiaca]|uniref:Undecaprenol kinase/diacylglycerol kinase (ATP) n=1 Tax=Arcicella aurantiaca TaxID=591202 RepID=A0A316EFE2_9BACT|nr:diacylglycerol kinase family protein [Arcicella aurantiaca]PWK29310.1 undecaprenol kinase/diacylglycerol kinase (ATP) [Arcicella aurantiaca]